MKVLERKETEVKYFLNPREIENTFWEHWDQDFALFFAQHCFQAIRY